MANLIDNFTGGNQTPIATPNWASDTGTGNQGANLASNQLKQGSDSAKRSLSYRTDSSNNYSVVVYKNVSTSDNMDNGPAIHCDGAGAWYYASVSWYDIGAGNQWVLFIGCRHNDDWDTVIEQAAGITPAVGGALILRRSGSNIICEYWNGTSVTQLFSGANTTLSGGKDGVFMSTGTNTSGLMPWANYAYFAAKTGTGALNSPSSTVAGSGKNGNPGTGALTNPTTTIAGSGKRGSKGTGALSSPSSTMAGTGTVNSSGGHVTGSGALSSPSSAVAGSGITTTPVRLSDMFPGSNQTPISSPNWVSNTTGAIQGANLTSNRLVGGSTGTKVSASYRSDSSNHYSEIRYAVVGTSINDSGPTIHNAAGGTFYYGALSYDGSDYSATITLLSAGSPTTLYFATVGFVPVVGSILRLRRSGNTLLLDYKSSAAGSWTNIGSVVDTTLLTGFDGAYFGANTGHVDDAQFNVWADFDYNPITGSGALTNPTTTIAGSGKRGSMQLGGGIALSSPLSTIAGVGVINGAGQHITGTGALSSPSSTIASAGVLHHIGTGALNSPASTVAGTASTHHPGTGAITSPSSTITGVGVINGAAQHLTGSGSLTSPTPTVVAGAGVRRINGTGALVNPNPTVVTGAGTRHAVGTGALLSPSSSIAGTGGAVKHITGTGTLLSPSSRIIGTDSHGGGGGSLGADRTMIAIAIAIG